MLASAFALCGAVASASEVGSDGAPLNGMAPLYVHMAPADLRAASAALTLPRVPANKAWYANWIMVVGSSPSVSHQMFVQIGLIRRPDQDVKLHVFVASQETDQRIAYREVGTTSDGTHRFVISQDRDRFALSIDGKAVLALNLPELAKAPRAYVEIGPEVFAEGDALAGSVQYAAIDDGDDWKPMRGNELCRYENHGTVLLHRNRRWIASGRFNRSLPSQFRGTCANI